MCDLYQKNILSYLSMCDLYQKNILSYLSMCDLYQKYILDLFTIYINKILYSDNILINLIIF